MTAEALVRPRRGVLRAVIDEARKRARNRRLRYLLVALAGVLAAGVVYASISRGPVSGSAGEEPVRLDRAAIPPLMHNGRLTLMTLADHQWGSGGWYGISSVGPSGGSYALVRCPHGVTWWCGDVESIDWSHDGARLAFGITSFGVKNPNNGLHVVNLRTGKDREIVHEGEYGEHGWLDVDWAPGGRRLAYATDGHIAILNANGTARRVLQTGTVGHDHSPSWSPDGRWVAFASRIDGVSSVYVIRADGSGRRLVARDGAMPAWSPDGSRIAFYGDDRLQFVTPNGKLLAPHPGLLRPGVPVGINAPPVWSPDGKKIAMSRRDGTWVMNADGTGLRRLTPYAGDSVGGGEWQRPAWRPRR